MAVVVRRGGAQDVRFLRDMLHHAYYWKERQPDAGPGPVQLYVKAWGRPGDTAMIALLDGFPVGAAWFRLFSAARPATGSSTSRPRSSRSPSSRTRAARASAARCSTRCSSAPGRTATRRVSLSVDRHNEGAIALYEQHGFRQVGETTTP